MTTKKNNDKKKTKTTKRKRRNNYNNYSNNETNNSQNMLLVMTLMMMRRRGFHFEHLTPFAATQSAQVQLNWPLLCSSGQTHPWLTPCDAAGLTGETTYASGRPLLPGPIPQQNVRLNCTLPRRLNCRLAKRSPDRQRHNLKEKSKNDTRKVWKKRELKPIPRRTGLHKTIVAAYQASKQRRFKTSSEPHQT